MHLHELELLLLRYLPVNTRLAVQIFTLHLLVKNSTRLHLEVKLNLISLPYHLLFQISATLISRKEVYTIYLVELWY